MYILHIFFVRCRKNVIRYYKIVWIDHILKVAYGVKEIKSWLYKKYNLFAFNIIKIRRYSRPTVYLYNLLAT